MSRVYFIESGKNGAVKIGVSVDVESRMRDLQCANPAQLRLIASTPGTHADEHELHRVFASEHISGEWFKGRGAVREFAEKLAADPTLQLPTLQLPKRAPKIAKVKKRRSLKPERVRRTPEEWHALIFVGEGSDIYQSGRESAEQIERLEKSVVFYDAQGGR